MTQTKKLVYKVHTCRGFTLIELLVSISIFTLLTGLILVNHGRFTSAILLENLAYDVGLSIREAQVFGLSVKEFEVGSGEFQTGYGVHFSKDTPRSYIIFADRNSDERYNDTPVCGEPLSECIEIFTIQRGNFIADFCGTLPDGTEKCDSSGLKYMDIMFVRPDPDAIIKSDLPGDTYFDATITIQSPKGAQRDIVTRVTGQISIPQGTSN